MNASDDPLGRQCRERTGALCLVCVIALLVSSCGVGHIRALREAQASFSRAAEIENRERLQDLTALGEMTEATTGYRIAAQILDGLLNEKRKELQKDNLLCTAFAIRALSLWRLGEHEGALTIAEEAKDCAPRDGSASFPPRDVALLRALPGLVRIDQANALVGNQVPEEFAAIKRLIKDARLELHAAQRLVPGNHPVRAYFLSSELAAIRVWHAAIASEELRGQQRTEELDKVQKEATSTWCTYKHFLTQNGQGNDRSVEFWKSQFSLSSDPDLCTTSTG